MLPKTNTFRLLHRNSRIVAGTDSRIYRAPVFRQSVDDFPASDCMTMNDSESRTAQRRCFRMNCASAATRTMTLGLTNGLAIGHASLAHRRERNATGGLSVALNSVYSSSRLWAMMTDREWTHVAFSKRPLPTQCFSIVVCYFRKDRPYAV